jgi:tRNA U34 5-carboxymethylaminomethyl modifying enzyme MnmG/GidA
MNKMKTKTEYPIELKMKDEESYNKAVDYINTVARMKDRQEDKDKHNYFLEDNINKEIRTTPSKRTIELTSNVDKEIINTLKGLSLVIMRDGLLGL